MQTELTPEELVGDEWAAWYRLKPMERWAESSKLWITYLTLGKSLDPEPDTQSPFFDATSAGHRFKPDCRLHSKLFLSGLLNDPKSTAALVRRFKM